MLDVEVQSRIEHVEGLLGAIENDPAALAAVAALVELYGECLARVTGYVAEAGGEAALGEIVEDELVAHLLLLHDLHPVDVETRVAQALAEVRPFLGSHGGDVELLGVENGIAKLRLNGTCDGCASSAVTLKHSIEDAVLRAAPELAGVEADGIEADGVSGQPQLLQIGSLRAAPGPCLPEPAR